MMSSIVCEKEKSPETLPTDRVLNKEQFYEKAMQKYASKTAPRPFFNFGK